MGTFSSSTEAVETAAERMRAAGADRSLPPALSLSGPSDITVSVGSAIDATYTVTNVGLSTATDIAVTLEGYDLSISPSSVESLPAGETAELTLSGVATEPTESLLVISAGAETARASLDVLDEDGHLDRALAIIGDIEDRLGRIADAADDNSSPDKDKGKTKGKGKNKPKGKDKRQSNGINGLQEKLTTARKRIEAVKSSASGSVSNEIKSIQKLMGAFINQVHGWGKNNLSNRNEAVLTNDAGGVVDELAAAA